MKVAGVTGAIVKAGGSNNADFPLYLETVHQANVRAVFGTCAHYWANGQVGTPAEIAKRVAGSGLVLPGERFAWDVETWTYRKPDGTIGVEAREWTPAEVVERATALAEITGGVPFTDQPVYLSLAQLRSYDWRPVVDLGMPLWIAAWDSGPVLARHWRKGGIWLRQYTSGSNAEIRKAYDADLDLNREPVDVWVVEELQVALNAAMPDLDPLDPDNDYGRMTTSRVTTWQERSGGKLKVDGDAGRLTLATLTKPE